MDKSTYRINIIPEDIKERKRKTALIVILLLLTLIPTILCIILGIRLGKLNNQVEKLVYNNKYKFEQYANASGTTNSNSELLNFVKKILGKDSNIAYVDEFDIGRIPNQSEISDKDNVSSDQEGKTEKDNTYKDSDKEPDNKNNINKDKDNKSSDSKKSNNEDADTKDAKKDKSDIKEKDSDKDITQKPPEKTDNKDQKKEESNKDNKDKKDKEDISKEEKESEANFKNKKVYLTFDDGPTYNTDKILDILAEYNVKATFFVIGSTDEVDKERYRRIVNEGHTLGMHSYSHDYNKIYNSLEDFDKDFTKLMKLLYDTTGYTPTIYRFPGGSLNHVSKSDMKIFIKYLIEKEMNYYDWNVVNGDAEGVDYTEEEMIDKVLEGVASKKTSIVLMHDGHGKEKTVASLPKLLEALISRGAEILPMDENVPLIQQIKVSSVD
ncbi:polysaccharide deacetylase family protein [Herbinix luporum]|uniref:polysaccharide deacetylase family protein n=1 Tax=Herbinix luporum TaxID=1679721 RepID=UPI0017556D69|nr:polysaccharide deacetylase family protein [Herbinix luporum]HHT57028.1 polysaccharide deacetylase family protein [Herbinix luporum]